MKIINSKQGKILRRSLRSNMNEPEQLLWARLRGKQLGYKFRRQVSIGSYVVDFYCPAAHLAIEVDGDSHYQEAGIVHDIERSAFMRSIGIHVFRCTNLDVYQNIEGVIEAILDTIVETDQNPL